MDTYASSNSRFRRFTNEMLPQLEPYKVDEGYSEETRSSDGSESSMRLDLPKSGEEMMQPPLSASFEHFIRGLSDYERGEIAYDLLRGLRASTISRVFDRLWPLFHKDPLEILPPEIMSLVLSYLEPRDLLTVSLVSGAWRERITDSNLWRKKFNIEGWSLDASEIARLEHSLHISTSATKRRRSTQLSSEQRSPLQRTGPFHGGDIANEVSMDDVHNSQHKPGTSRSFKMEDMPEVEANQMDIDQRQTPHHSPTKAIDNVIPSTHAVYDASTHILYPKRRLVINSAPGHPRINYHYIFKQKRRLEDNWDRGCYRNFQLPHRDAPHEAHEECVYTIQYQGDFLVSGSRDKTLRIWNLATGRLVRSPLMGHTGSVLCLQFDSRPEEDIIISGSSDTNVILWRFSTGEMIRKLSSAHSESVLNLRFDDRYLVTCSKDKSIKIWNRNRLRPGDVDYPKKGHQDGGQCPDYILNDPVTTEIPRWQPSSQSHLLELEPYMHLMTLSSHGAAVNAIQIYQDQLVSASGDRHLRVWDIHTGQNISRINAHDKGIACVQYDGKRIVSGSSDNSIRIWDPASKTEVARLEGHTRLVRTLQAAFADVPGGREQLEAEAAEVDRQWEVARDHGEEIQTVRGSRASRPGSRRPQNLRAIGAKIPPSGGGSRWARIISGSYDEKIIVWKKNADDEWVIGHILAQEQALTAAGPPILTRSPANGLTEAEDMAIPRTPPVVRSIFAPRNRSTSRRVPSTHLSRPPLALAPPPFNPIPPTNPPIDPPTSFPALPTSPSQPRDHIDETDHPVSSPNNDATSSHPLVQAQKSPPQPDFLPESADTRSGEASRQPQATQAHTRRTGRSDQPAILPIPGSATTMGRTAIPAVAPAASRHPQLPAAQPNARVFKLQFDARRIICCSQDNKIVGWDFANGDEDIIACSKFFADPQ